MDLAFLALRRMCRFAETLNFGATKFPAHAKIMRAIAISSFFGSSVLETKIQRLPVVSYNAWVSAEAAGAVP